MTHCSMVIWSVGFKWRWWASVFNGKPYLSESTRCREFSIYLFIYNATLIIIIIIIIQFHHSFFVFLGAYTFTCNKRSAFIYIQREIFYLFTNFVFPIYICSLFILTSERNFVKDFTFFYRYRISQTHFFTPIYI